MKLILTTRSLQPGRSPSQSSGLPSQPSDSGMGGSKHIGVGVIVGVAVSLHVFNSHTDANIIKVLFVGWGCCCIPYISCLSILLSTAVVAARHGVCLVYWPQSRRAHCLIFFPISSQPASFTTKQSLSAGDVPPVPSQPLTHTLTC